MGVFDLNNVVDFLGGFGQKRTAIAAQNQEAKDYKLKTIETMFSMAEGRRAQAEASAEAAEDTSLSTDARARHRAAAEKSLQEGSRIYDGASELFGMIDDKPKAAGKKENPAMQFLKFANPFTRRGPESGEFEERLQELMVGLGGKGMSAADVIGAAGGGAGDGGGGGTVGAGLGDISQRGQGSPSPEAMSVAALRAAMPGGEGARPATAGQLLSQDRGEPLVGAETIPGTIFPTETALGIPQPDFSLAGAAEATAPPEAFPYITFGRYAPQFGAMPTDQFEDGVAQEVIRALTGLAAIQQKTEYITETFEDMANIPEAWDLYIAASSGTSMHPGLDNDKLDRDLAMIFPDLRPDRPDAGETLLRQFESDLRRTMQNDPGSILGEKGEVLPPKFWPKYLQMSAAKYSVLESVSTDKPEVPMAKRFLDAVRLDPKERSPQHLQDIKAYQQARIELGMGGGAGGTAGATENITFGSARHDSGQMAMVRRGSKTGQVEFVINPKTNQPYFTGKADISRWQSKVATAVIKDGRYQEIFPMLPFVILADLRQELTTRAILRPLMESPLFDQETVNIINDFLDRNPEIGGPEPPGYVPVRVPNPFRDPRNL
jgi:hypothetical protein